MSDNRRKPDPEERKRRIVLIVVALAAALLFTFLSSFFYDSVTKKEITYNQFISLLDNGMVKEVVFDDSKIIITPKMILKRTSWSKLLTGLLILKIQI